MDGACLLADEAWLEKDLTAAKALASDGDDVASRKLVSLLFVGGSGGLLHLDVEIQGNVCKFLLDIADNFTPRGVLPGPPSSQC